MSKLLLIHNSDMYFPDGIKAKNMDRPNFYWYTDRFVSHIGTYKYLYIFVIDPISDGVELRCRTKPFDFDAMHKYFLHYKDYHDGKLPDFHYAESGIAMSFSKLTPTITLKATGNENDALKLDYKIIKPAKHFGKKTVVRLFKEPYSKMHQDKPIKFSDIPELAELIPDIEDVLPFKQIEPDSNGKYKYNEWLPMSVHENGTWL